MTDACYVYAIVARGTPLPAQAAGVAVELALVPWRRLAAVVAPVADDDAPPTVESALHHEAVVEAVRALGPALPVRFGTVFRDATSVARALAQRHETLVADLERLGDRVEMGLTALWTTPPTVPAARAQARPTPQTGAHYLRALAAEMQHAELLASKARAAADTLDAALGSLSLEQRTALLPTPRIAVRTAYLLDPRTVQAFRAAVERVRVAAPELRVLLTGPWPPYSFAGATGAGHDECSERGLAALVRTMTDALQTAPLSGSGA